MYNADTTVQLGLSGQSIPQNHQGANNHITAPLDNSVPVNQSLAASEPLLHIFSQNVAAPSALPSHSNPLATTAQLAYWNNLVRMHMSPSLAKASVIASLNPDQQASIDAIL